MSDIAIPCSLYRGGTSRGLLFLEEHLPDSRAVLGRILLRVFGSPDARQIDGIGGATSLTSKALIVAPDPAPDVDVRMTFAQIGVPVATVGWSGNCGNMTAAVGPFAIETGLVRPVAPVTTVRIRSVNTGVIVHVHVPVENGHVCTEGDYAIAGVPGTAARIDLEWLNPGGTVTGQLLPTGCTSDRFVLADGRSIDVSLVDAVNPVVFCRASALGLTGTELPPAIEANAAVMQALEEIRSIAAERLGIVPDRSLATRESPGLPKVAFVARRAKCRTLYDRETTIDTHDLQARLLSMQTAHRAYAASGAICTAVAALLPNTIVHGCTEGEGVEAGTVRLGHPAGVMDVRVKMDRTGSGPQVVSATVARTARRIMSGVVWVPQGVIQDQG